MCTISWLASQEEMLICFSRDERNERAQATKPELFSTKRGESLHPIDPDGGGTWLAVTEYGEVFALLNEYPKSGSFDKDGLTTRGQIIQMLLNQEKDIDLDAFFDQEQLTIYPPFSFFYLSLDTQRQWRWDGEHVLQRQAPNMYTSSPICEVVEKRERLFEQLAPSSFSELNLFHQGHWPEPSVESICMHHDIAHTVSLSKVHIKKDEVIFEYLDGQPCTTRDITTLTIPRK
ncbi:NRDE family protein [Algicola sagamiensis]|uniref:NRDE family protein n=1 Tax=Algicola sagamiensis TaxID=163869 RepID=UPI00037BEF6C|nr:NRDE family protein [Algicola sagamiensis]